MDSGREAAGTVTNVQQSGEDEEGIPPGNGTLGKGRGRGPAKRDERNAEVSRDAPGSSEFRLGCWLPVGDMEALDAEAALEIEGQARCGIDTTAE